MDNETGTMIAKALSDLNVSVVRASLSDEALAEVEGVIETTERAYGATTGIREAFYLGYSAGVKAIRGTAKLGIETGGETDA